MSDEAPLGRAILGKKAGQHFSYIVGNNVFEGKILEILSPNSNETTHNK
ncbi:MAG: GreA/GreB family elongation factor [Clostridiales bacterium]|nr:GreA/GreB family elongation factor [Clostridiales bacterium]